MVSEIFPQPSAEDERLSSVEKRARGTVEEYTGLPYHLMLVRDGEDKGKAVDGLGRGAARLHQPWQDFR